jgi:hypothetical protein
MVRSAAKPRISNHVAAPSFETPASRAPQDEGGAMRFTPAMAAGVTDKLWEISDVEDMLETWEAVSAKS